VSDTAINILLSLVSMAVGIIGGLLIAAKNAGLFQGRTERITANVEQDIRKIHDKLSTMKKEVDHVADALETRVQKLHDLAIVNQNDIEHLKQFRAELRDTLRDLERTMREAKDSRITRHSPGDSHARPRN
jgi:phage-related minor tail protein